MNCITMNKPILFSTRMSFYFISSQVCRKRMDRMTFCVYQHEQQFQYKYSLKFPGAYFIWYFRSFASFGKQKGHQIHFLWETCVRIRIWAPDFASRFIFALKMRTINQNVWGSLEVQNWSNSYCAVSKNKFNIKFHTSQWRKSQ